MIAKRFILEKSFDIKNEFTKESILSRCNTSDKSAEKVTILVDAEKQNCEVTMTINRTKDLIVLLFESKDSDILGTNVYITSALVAESVPKLAKVCYVNARMFVLAYYNDPKVELIVEELERLALFIVGNKINNGDINSWKDLMKSYTESNIGFCTDGIPPTNGEKYIYTTRKNLICDPNIFNDEK